MSRQEGDKKKTALDSVEVKDETVILAPPKNPVSAEPIDTDPPESPATPTEADDYEESGYELFAKDLIKYGDLDSEFKVERGLSGSDLRKAYANKLKKELEPTVKEQIVQELRELGASAEDIQIARLMRQGMDINVLQNKVVLYDRLRNKRKDATDEFKESAVAHMYADQGYDDDDIKTLLETAKATDGRLDALYDKSVKNFDEKYNQVVEEQDRLYSEQRKAYTEQIERENNHVRSALNKGELYGEKIDKQLAKEIERGIYEATEVFEVGGQRQAVSQFQKFIYEFNNNPELRVAAFKNYQFPKESLKNVKKDIKKEVEEDFLSGYKKNVVKKKVEPVPQKKNSFIIEM